jgi:uridine kinase
LLVAIVGGSGSGKTWLAQQLMQALPSSSRVSQDDFYKDRSHLPFACRVRVNFDNPRSLDWEAFAHALSSAASGLAATVPCYDFATHSRQAESRTVSPGRFVVVDGLWLLRRPDVRRLFHLRIFLDCPAHLRLQRRLQRDQACRGRNARSIRVQFRTMVEPMHRRFVAPQAKWADLVIRGACAPADVRAVAACLLGLPTNKPGLLSKPTRCYSTGGFRWAGAGF